MTKEQKAEFLNLYLQDYPKKRTVLYGMGLRLKDLKAEEKIDPFFHEAVDQVEISCIEEVERMLYLGAMQLSNSSDRRLFLMAKKKDVYGAQLKIEPVKKVERDALDGCAEKYLTVLDVESVPLEKTDKKFLQ